MIGIIGAMSIETEEIRNQMTVCETRTIANTEFVRGILWGEEAVVATCGAGKVFAAVAAQTMILVYQVDYIVNVGVAGTLSEQLHIGDLAIATKTVQHDMDVSALGAPIGEVCKINVTYFPCDEKLVRKAQAAAKAIGIPYQTGVIATGDQFISSHEQKEILVERFGAISCEMEGGAIGHTCYINKVPYIVLRAMSDEADGGAPDDFEAFAKKSAMNTVRLLCKMLVS